MDRDGTSPSPGVLACPCPCPWTSARCTLSSSSGSTPNNAAFSAIISASDVIPFPFPFPPFPLPGRVMRLVWDGLVMPEPVRPFFSATPYQPLAFFLFFLFTLFFHFFLSCTYKKELDSPAARKNFLRLISLKPDINVNVARVWKSLCDRRMAYTRFGLALSWW